MGLKGYFTHEGRMRRHEKSLEELKRKRQREEAEASMRTRLAAERKKISKARRTSRSSSDWGKKASGFVGALDKATTWASKVDSQRTMSSRKRKTRRKPKPKRRSSRRRPARRVVYYY